MGALSPPVASAERGEEADGSALLDLLAKKSETAPGRSPAVDFSFLSLELLDSHFPGQAELFEDLAYFGLDCCCRICGDGH